MFKEVTIKNFALIDDLNIKLYKGLNIIMGETGSGKSNLIDSISILLGDRAQKDKIRKGESKAFISGVFDISDNEILIQYLKDNNYYLEDEPLIISREISHKSSTISKVNNISVPSGVLKEISKYLIDIYGQFENISILSKNEQRNFIDSLGNRQHNTLLLKYENLYIDFIDKIDSLEAFKKSPEEVNRNLEFLEFQINDIELSGVLEIDEEELDAKLEIIENYQNLRDNTGKIISILDSNEYDVLSSLGRITSYSEDIANVDKSFEESSNRLSQVYIELEDIKRDIDHYFETLNFDEEEYRALDEKRSILFESKRKYGNTLEEIKKFYEKAKTQLLEIKNYEINLKIKEDEIKNLRLELKELAMEISESRKSIVKTFQENVEIQLAELEMEDTTFEVKFETLDLNLKGIDEITFMISFNKNEPLKEFSSVASGGEISRFMLAIKSIEAELENTPTIIFDEIDTGISGNAGNIVGNKLKSLSNNHQLICISHLPQIIAKGDSQLLVYKENIDGRITSIVKALDYEERVRELARIIEGDNFSSHTLKTAKKMIDDNLRGVK